MPDLSTRYLGLTLKNPLVPSSSPLGRNVDHALHLEDAGASAIVLHSLFEEEVRNEERMLERFFLNPEVSTEASGHLTADDTSYRSRLDEYLDHIETLKSRLSIPVVASLNGVTPGGWLSLGREMEEAGADALELNTWYLSGDEDTSGADIEAQYLDLLTNLKASVKIPVSLKLSPFFSSLPHFVRRASEAGAAGVALFDRFFQPDIDVDSLTMLHRVQLSTSDDLLLTMRWIAILRGRAPLTLAATGGVHTRDDVLKMLLAGADVVHLASTLLLNGPQQLATLLREMQQWLEEREYVSVEQLKGAMSQQNLPDPGTWARAAYLDTLDAFSPPAGVRY